MRPQDILAIAQKRAEEYNDSPIANTAAILAHTANSVHLRHPEVASICLHQDTTPVHLSVETDGDTPARYYLGDPDVPANLSDLLPVREAFATITARLGTEPEVMHLLAHRTNALLPSTMGAEADEMVGVSVYLREDEAREAREQTRTTMQAMAED